ncbi:MAG: Ni/Fe-hydrogenase cytochrome b subunit [Holophagaceae bacterium]|nr:Ni/Fe-hydrogenase cytochrome b subunit [Holophagaceae bacterium]
MTTSAVLPAKKFRPGFWTFFFGLVTIPFCIVTVLRFYKGLGAVTHLSDKFPWGLWIGFDLLCGVGLAAGAFTLTAAVHLFNLKKFEPIVRPTILTGFLGYIFVITALMFDLGQPWRIWHAIVYWNPHSVMFEVAWCVMLYTTVLAVEFAPVVLERFGFHAPMRIIHGIITPLVIAGVLLSTLHQSSLGSLYLIVPSKLHPLWYSQLLPLFFFISAIGAGIGMVILESYMSKRAFGRHLEMDLLEPLARAMVVALGIYGMMRLQAIARNGAFSAITDFTYEGRMFLVEFVLGVLLPVALLSFRRLRTDPTWLVAGSFLAVLGFVVNRLNVSITGMEGAAGVRYVPSFPEIIISVGLVGIGMAAFALAVRYLNIFPEQAVHAEGRPEGG